VFAHRLGVDVGAGTSDDERLEARAEVRIGDADEIRRYVRTQLARFKVPRDVEFVAELPRNGTGKVVRRDLEMRADP